VAVGNRLNCLRTRRRVVCHAAGDMLRKVKLTRPDIAGTAGLTPEQSLRLRRSTGIPASDGEDRLLAAWYRSLTQAASRGEGARRRELIAALSSAATWPRSSQNEYDALAY
jgi:hypothetical protein